MIVTKFLIKYYAKSSTAPGGSNFWRIPFVFSSLLFLIVLLFKITNLIKMENSRKASFAATITGYPKSVYFILTNELFERFRYVEETSMSQILCLVSMECAQYLL